MTRTKETLVGSMLSSILSVFGCGRNEPAQTQDREPQQAEQTTVTDLSDSDLRELTRFLPDFIDSLQHRERGDEAKAALSMLAALPLGGNPEVINRNGNRILWATTVHGLDRLKDTASLARDSEDAGIRQAKRKELAELLRLDDVNERTNAILEKIQQGQTPTERELAILKVAADFMRSESPTKHGE
jgi:hypothetical protein